MTATHRYLYAVVTLATVAAALTALELSTFWLQSLVFEHVSAPAVFRLEPGPSPAIVFPDHGVSDSRLGYVGLPDRLARLHRQGYRVTAQARWSQELVGLAERGLNPPYPRKQQAGLVLTDRHGTTLYRARYPHRVYPGFEAVPPLVAATLLHIENRELLDPTTPHRNPAVEWDRLALSLTAQVRRLAGSRTPTPGASTLATQLEKYRHSPGGLTDSLGEKARQMLSASLRAYHHGSDTRTVRRRIVTEYLNTVPLAAAPGAGEVNGIGDGLAAWFGADFDAVNRALRGPDGHERALAYRQVLSLLLAQRRPTDYLLHHRERLAALAVEHLPRLAGAGIISTALLEDALDAEPAWLPAAAGRPVPSALVAGGRNWPYRLRSELAAMLDVPSLYALDRLDLTVTTTIDHRLQQHARRLLNRLRQPDAATRALLAGRGLLGDADPADVHYSIQLVERAPGGHRIRIQTDTLDQPFDINRGAMLDLGSTAKLRTLVSYLETIDRLYLRFALEDPATLDAALAARGDTLASWVIRELQQDPRIGRRALLTRSLARRYPASPRQPFFTGGGIHRFENFDAGDNHRQVTVREAFRHSINLPFVRLLEDVVETLIWELPGAPAARLAAGDEALRRHYLERFADQEGRTFLRRFFRARAAARDSDGTVPSSGSRRPHPLETWLDDYLAGHPDADLDEVLTASADARQDAYAWLFRTRRRGAQDQRIHTILEQDAFARLHADWQRLGYPFDALVPSLATAIGSSADRPAALTELLGIIASRGLRQPLVSVETLEFAAHTPYATTLERASGRAERVLSGAVADTVRAALEQVVSNGTARRLSWLAPDWAGRIGGKTGTGDHRYERHDRLGHTTSSRVRNRTAVFTFQIDGRYFGTVTAWVPGQPAAAHRFTSALPVQVLGMLLEEVGQIRAAVGPGSRLRHAVPVEAAVIEAGLKRGLDHRKVGRQIEISGGERPMVSDLVAQQP